MDFFDVVFIAKIAHGDQLRKYTNEPYFIHLAHIAYNARSYCANKLVGSVQTILIVAAAILHDILEDTTMSVEELKTSLCNCFTEYIASEIVAIVVECTDVYTKEAYPNHNRAERKALEAARLRNISYEAAIIKLFDYQDNIASIKEHDPKFAELYEKEKDAYLPFLIEKYGL